MKLLAWVMFPQPDQQWGSQVQVGFLVVEYERIQSILVSVSEGQHVSLHCWSFLCSYLGQVVQVAYDCV